MQLRLGCCCCGRQLDPVGPLAWELPHAACAALKKTHTHTHTHTHTQNPVGWIWFSDQFVADWLCSRAGLSELQPSPDIGRMDNLGRVV